MAVIWKSGEKSGSCKEKLQLRGMHRTMPCEAEMNWSGEFGTESAPNSRGSSTSQSLDSPCGDGRLGCLVRQEVGLGEGATGLPYSGHISVLQLLLSRGHYLLWVPEAFGTCSSVTLSFFFFLSRLEHREGRGGISVTTKCGQEALTLCSFGRIEPDHLGEAPAFQIPTEMKTPSQLIARNDTSDLSCGERK